MSIVIPAANREDIREEASQYHGSNRWLWDITYVFDFGRVCLLLAIFPLKERRLAGTLLDGSRLDSWLDRCCNTSAAAPRRRATSPSCAGINRGGDPANVSSAT